MRWMGCYKISNIPDSERYYEEVDVSAFSTLTDYIGCMPLHFLEDDSNDTGDTYVIVSDISHTIFIYFIFLFFLV